MWCRVGMAARRVTRSNDIWSFREPRDRLIAASLHELSSSLHFSIATRSLSVLLAFFAPLCVYIHFSLNNRLRQVSVCVLLVQIQKKFAGEREHFYVHPKFSKIYFRKQLASSEQLRVLTRHFRMQQLTCGAHWWAAGATGPREALSEQYFAPCLLLCQPPEKTWDENAISCRLITASR